MSKKTIKEASSGDYFAHESCVIDSGATIGDGSNIWHFCHIFPGAEIGKDCVIGQGCSIASDVVIGNNCKLQNGISVYDGVRIEDDVFCGPHMVFTNVINPRAFIERKDEFRPTLLKKGCTVGANATILCGVTIGSYALVGAGSVVTKNVPDFALLYGNPAKHVGWVDKRGNKLEFTTDCNEVVGSDSERYVLVDDKVAVAV